MDVAHTNNNYDAITAEAGVIYQDTDPEMGGSTRLRGLSSERMGSDVKLGEDLLEDQ